MPVSMSMLSCIMAIVCLNFAWLSVGSWRVRLSPRVMDVVRVRMRVRDRVRVRVGDRVRVRLGFEDGERAVEHAERALHLEREVDVPCGGEVAEI